MTLKIISTADGSHTIQNCALMEHYHSIHGAVQESKHVFIESGLFEAVKLKREITILEIGMGTGLNAWLTLRAALEHDLNISYLALEPFPLPSEIWESLNYPLLAPFPDGIRYYKAIHMAAEGRWTEITREFRIFRSKDRLEDFRYEEGSFDLVYFDAFGPSVQPEIWSAGNFRKIAGLMAPGAVLVTYSSKGEVKRALISSGLSVEKIPGPPGKREMLRARRVVT